MGFASTTLTVSEILTNSNTVGGAAIVGPLVESIGIASETVSKWKIPCTSVDNAALTLFNKVKQRQLDIATVGGNTGLGSDCYIKNIALGAFAMTTLYGDLVSGVATAYGSTFGINNGSATTVTYGTIKYDALEAYRYPKLETLDASGDNPLEGEGYVTITSSNAGIGKSTAYTRGGGSSAGIVFAFAAPGCAEYTGIANSLSSLKTQYNSEYVGLASHANNANLLKGYKHSAQLEWWSLNKSSSSLSVGITSNNSASSIISSYP